MYHQKIDEFLRQEQEHEQQLAFLATTRAEMHNKGASDHSIRIALTGLHKYTQSTPDPANDQETNPQTAPVSNVPTVPT